MKEVYDCSKIELSAVVGNRQLVNPVILAWIQWIIAVASGVIELLEHLVQVKEETGTKDEN